MQPITLLPPCRSVSILIPYMPPSLDRFIGGQQQPLITRITWSALCSCPGLRCLGSEDHDLQGTVQIIGCTELPQHFPLALVVYGELDYVQGVPKAEFKQVYHKYMHVWRNAAAADLKL